MEFKKLQDKVIGFKDLQYLARSLVDGALEETKKNSEVIDCDDIYEPTAEELAQYRAIIEDERLHEVTICLRTVTWKVSSNCRIKSNMFKYIIADDYILWKDKTKEGYGNKTRHIEEKAVCTG